MPHLQAQVPQQIEQVLHHALAPRRLLVGQDKQQIEIGGGCEQTPAEASGSDDRHTLRVRWIGRPINVLDRIVEHQPNECVVEQRQAFGTAASVAIAFKLPCGRCAGLRNSSFNRSTTAGRAAATEPCRSIALSRSRPTWRASK